MNYRSRSRNEIDIIAKDKGCLVFVEVKYRRDGRKGDPAEAVDAGKQSRIRRAACQYLYEHPQFQPFPCRFDVVAILGEEIRVISDAF